MGGGGEFKERGGGVGDVDGGGGERMERVEEGSMKIEEVVRKMRREKEGRAWKGRRGEVKGGGEEDEEEEEEWGRWKGRGGEYGERGGCEEDEDGSRGGGGL